MASPIQHHTQPRREVHDEDLDHCSRARVEAGRRGGCKGQKAAYYRREMGIRHLRQASVMTVERSSSLMPKFAHRPGPQKNWTLPCTMSSLARLYPVAGYIHLAVYNCACNV